MVLLVLLVLALYVFQIVLPTFFRRFVPGQDAGEAMKRALGPRDEPLPQSRLGGRAQRALGNMQENLPIFLALALLNLIVGNGEARLALLGATVFLVARVLYVPAYLAGILGVRSLIWAAGLVGLILMLMPLLDRI